MPRGAQVIYPKDLGPILHARRHRPGRAGARVRASARARCRMTMLRAGADDRRLRAARGLRQPGPRRTCARSSATSALDALPRRAARLLRGHRRAATSTASCSTCPSRGRWCPHAEGALRPGGILVAYTPSIMQVATAARGAGAARRHGSRRDARGAAPRLARRGAGGAPRPPHGRPHRLPHRGPLPGSLRERRPGERVAEGGWPRTSSGVGQPDQGSMKMHSPGHSSADSMTASSWPSGTSARPSAPWALPLAVGEDLVAFLHVGEAVVEQGEDVGGDLFAEPVAGAEILVDPDLHAACASLGSRRRVWRGLPKSPESRVSPSDTTETRPNPRIKTCGRNPRAHDAA